MLACWVFFLVRKYSEIGVNFQKFRMSFGGLLISVTAMSIFDPAAADFYESHILRYLVRRERVTRRCSQSKGAMMDCYDPLDPNGNITVTFDIHSWTAGGYLARVTIQNYHLYRHVDQPGWNLGWTWRNQEIILSMNGAFATKQGNCSSFKFEEPAPHSCEKDPQVLDLLPEASPENRSENCCRAGLLSALATDPSKSFSSFEIRVGNLGLNNSEQPPANLTLLAPGQGYTCSPLVDTDPSVSSVIGGRRKIQVYRTWKSTCTYSSFLANKTPVCCVSLSTFYNPKVTPCRLCSCGCRDMDQTAVSCVRPSSSISSLSSSSSTDGLDMVRCTDHMCPVGVHWHIKNNYVDHWRVKLTVSNYNYDRNYSDWNILVQHPGFRQPSIIFSFNSSAIPSVAYEDAVAVFWGIESYNIELLQADDEKFGFVTTEILLRKDPESFTLSNGWGFPRRIYFNGDDCQLSLPDSFPALPNSSFKNYPSSLIFLLFFFVSLF